MFGTGRALGQDQEDGGLGGGEHDADEGLQRYVLPFLGAQPGKAGCADHGHPQGQEIGLQGILVAAQDHGDGHAEGRHLGKRQVDENHAPAHDVEAQVGVDAGEQKAGQQGGSEKGQAERGCHGKSLRWKSAWATALSVALGLVHDPTISAINLLKWAR